MFDDLLRDIDPMYWGILAVCVVAGGAVLLMVWRLKSAGRGREGTHLLEDERASSGRWAKPADVQDMWEPKGGNEDPRRMLLGMLGKQPLIGDPHRSLLVLAPTGAGKTPRVVVPTVLRHRGPAVVASVKGDVLALTRKARAAGGPVWVFDPDESTGPTARWSPLSTVHTWADALDAAEWVQESSKAAEGKGLEGQKFWDDEGQKLLAPLLLLVAQAGGTMTDVLSLVATLANESDAQELTTSIAECDLNALNYWSLFQSLESRTRANVLATASNVLKPWSHPRVANAVNVEAGDTANVLHLDELLDNNGTLYLVAPASTQRQFNAVYETLVNAILMAVEKRYGRTSHPLSPPCLLMLDEAANIAPLRRLDMVASAMAGMGLIVVTVWQDEGQIEGIYGPAKARVVVANHTNRLFLPGISDLRTLQGISDAVGTDLVQRHVSSDTGGGSSQWHSVRTAPPESIRELDADLAIMLSGRRKPMLLKVPGWFEDPALRAKVDADVAAEFDRQFAKPSRRRRRAHA